MVQKVGLVLKQLKTNVLQTTNLSFSNFFSNNSRYCPKCCGHECNVLLEIIHPAVHPFSPPPFSASMLFFPLRLGAALQLRVLRGLLSEGEPQRGDGGHAQQHPPVQQQPQWLSVHPRRQPCTTQTQPVSECCSHIWLRTTVLPLSDYSILFSAF